MSGNMDAQQIASPRGIIVMFAEALPEHCPPAEATEREEFIGYRLIRAKTPCLDDFSSHAARDPKKYGTSCRYFAVSLFSERASLARLLEMPVHKNKTIAKVRLTPQSGRVQQTGQDPCHHDWWRYKDFDVVSACEVEE